MKAALLRTSLAAALLAGTGGGSQEDWVPPRLQSGDAPSIPPLAATGGLVVVEAKIVPAGLVEEVVVVDDAPPFTAAVVEAVKLWRFRPAASDGYAVSSRATIVALFRAPVLMGGAPPPPERVAAPSRDVPYPLETRAPAFPPQALYDGIAILEVEVDAAGRVGNAGILSSAPGFDDVALEAARAFRFEPAERSGRPVAAYAILVFGIPQPLTTPRLRRDG